MHGIGNEGEEIPWGRAQLLLPEVKARAPSDTAAFAALRASCPWPRAYVERAPFSGGLLSGLFRSSRRASETLIKAAAPASAAAGTRRAGCCPGFVSFRSGDPSANPGVAAPGAEQKTPWREVHGGPSPHCSRWGVLHGSVEVGVPCWVLAHLLTP